MIKTKILLQKSFFNEKEKDIIQSGELSASTFLYPSGVAALRVKNEKGELIWLPFKGQQIWRASFCGKALTMKSTFDEPVDTEDFSASYGCFMLHCGMTAMGNPTPADTHPQHGELPSIQYDNAYLTLGEDEKGHYMELGGDVRYRQCFTTDYTAKPTIRLYEKDTVMDINMTVKNNRNNPLDYLYLCHLNFRPVEGAKLVYSASRDSKSIFVHKDIPENLSSEKAAKMAAYMEKLQQNPAIMDVFDSASQMYDPEIVFSVFYDTDENGWARCLQIEPDGSAGYVSFKPSELPYGIRWISNTGDESAMGMCLPATAEHKGLKHCKENNQIKTLQAKESITFHVKAGWLAQDRAAVEAEKCTSK